MCLKLCLRATVVDLVPHLMDWTPTLQGDEERHGLWQGINSATGERCKHYTNIQRVEALAMLHPLIDEVEQHKMGKGDGERLYLAAPGATMHCGVSVHKQEMACFRQTFC